MDDEVDAGGFNETYFKRVQEQTNKIWSLKAVYVCSWVSLIASAVGVALLVSFVALNTAFGASSHARKAEPQATTQSETVEASDHH